MKVIITNKTESELTKPRSVHDLLNAITCEDSWAKKAAAARNQDPTARLAHGKLHVTTCNPPRAKKAAVVPNQGYTAQLAHDKTHVT